MRSRRSSSGASRASSAPRPDGTPTDGLVIQDVAKRFGRFPALAGVSLQVQPGEFLALLGPSGSGKTTLLRIIGGLEQPDAGSVSLDGDDFLALSARERRVGMVFQHYALFRHMNVATNIAFGLQARPRSQRPPKKEIAERVEKLLAFMQLDGLGKRYPAQLSGGQRQRVALARAMAIEPRVLLLDEPFGALDAKVRRELRRWLRHVHDETGVTTVFVTHDQEEAMDLADRVAVLREGAIEQVGTPAALAEKPDSAFVFDFLGDANRLPCQLSGGLARFGEFTAPAVNADAAPYATEAWFRPHETDLSASGPGLPVKVQGVSQRGAVLRAECLADDGRTFDADFSRGLAPADVTNGARLMLRPRRVYVFADSRK